MEELEQEILAWYLDNYPKYSDCLEQQFKHCTVTGREFTDGGGVFINFTLTGNYPRLQLEKK